MSVFSVLYLSHQPVVVEDNMNNMNKLNNTNSVSAATRVGIIGGGTAGSTIAIRLAELGVETYLFERSASLIDGPPMCHLHAGGNLYREIPDEDCVALLEQCIDILRLYPYTIDVRPTVFAVPTHDDGTPQDLLPRLDILTDAYRALIERDPANKVLGEPDDYYQLYDRTTLEALAKLPQKKVPQTTDEWMIPVAKFLDLDKVQFPIIVAQEYGWNIFRLSASATLALADKPCAHVHTNSTVLQVLPASTDESATAASKWRIDYQINAKPQEEDSVATVKEVAIVKETGVNEAVIIDAGINETAISLETGKAVESEEAIETQSVEVDYLINACGFRTGIIDDMVGVDSERMVEFKSSYVTYWDLDGAQIPEIIIYGERGTPHGMAQLTPYPDGFFQIHGMSKDITLFKDGLVASSNDSSQPSLPHKYVEYIEEGWDPFALKARSQRAIEFVAQYLPSFKSAIIIGNALYGGQQIPGKDDTLRVADVSLYDDKRYARAENVKASSALLAADEIVATLIKLGLLTAAAEGEERRHAHDWPYLDRVTSANVDEVAQTLAKQRHFPTPMGKVNHGIAGKQASGAVDGLNTHEGLVSENLDSQTTDSQLADSQTSDSQAAG